MTELVTSELKVRIYELFERHDKIVEQQDEYIEQLRERNKHLQSENTRLKAERDKAVEDIKKYAHISYTCIYKNSPDCHVEERCFCLKCPAWQWRGLEELK